MRLIVSGVCAIFVTLALFYLMQSLIGNGARPIDKPTGYGVVDFVRLQRGDDESPFVQPGHRPPPKPSPQPDTPALANLQWDKAEPPAAPRVQPMTQSAEPLQIGRPYLGPRPMSPAKPEKPVKIPQTATTKPISIPSPVPSSQPQESSISKAENGSQSASDALEITLPERSGSAAIGEPVGAVGVDSGSDQLSEGEAVPVFRIEPKYPRKAARKGIEGWVKVEFTITSKGTVTDPVVVDSRPRRTFDRSALQSIRKWRFKPKQMNGKAVERKASQVIEFKLARG